MGPWTAVASAQGVTPPPPPFTLAASPAGLAVTPGAHAIFTLTATTNLPLARTLDLTINTTAGWISSFTPQQLALPASGTANATLDLAAPSDAPINATYTFPVMARDATTAESAQTNVSITIVAPVMSDAVTPPPVAPPTLEISIPAQSGVAGSTVQGMLRLLDTDTTRDGLDVTLAIGGPAAWNPGFVSVDHIHLIYNAPKELPVQVTIPASAGNGTTSFPITAAVGGYQFYTTWNVTSTAAPVGTTAPASSATSGTGTGSTAPSPAAPVAQPHFVITSLDLQDLQPGFASKEVVRIQNNGNTPLSIQLKALVGDGTWPATIVPATMDLAPGETRDATLTLSAPASLATGREGSARATITGIAQGGLTNFLNLDLKIPAAAPATATTSAPATPPAASPPPSATNGAAIAVAAGLGAVGAGALVLMHRPWREKLIWAGVGLYTRLARPDILGHEERERLYKIIETQPGIHFHALQRDLGWNTGTLTYHLRVLEKHGFVVDRRDGLFRRFYLAGAAPRKETFETTGPQGLRADVYEAVKSRQGISQSDLALALGANKQTVNYHVKALERQGLIRVEKRGRETFLSPSAPGDPVPPAREAHA